MKNKEIKEAVKAITEVWHRDSRLTCGVRGDDIDVTIGQRLEPSYGWDYDYDRESDDKLDGTCAISLGHLWYDGGTEDEEAIIEAYRYIKEHYLYSNISVLAGEFAGYGNDKKEVIIKNAIVIYIFETE